MAETCVCFANAQGGTIVIGIEDKDLEPPKAQKIAVEDMNKVLFRLRTLTDGVGLANPKLVTHSNGGEFFYFKVLPSTRVIATTSSGKVLVRISDNCYSVKSEELTDLASEKNAFQWELVVVQKLRLDQADPDQVQYFLNERKEQYQADKKSDNYYKQAASLTKLKKEEGTVWLKEVNSQTLQFALKSLDSAYANFFRGNAKFPRFKSRRNKNSFTVPQFGKVTDDKLSIPKFKDGIKINMHREIKGKIGKMTITRTPTGKYFVSIFTAQDIEQLPTNSKAIGCDLGIKDFVITSDNKQFKNNRYTKKNARKLKQAQQHLSRKQKGSNGFEKQKIKVAKIHEKISNSRLDTLHKVSNELIRNNQIIAIEDLNVKGMIKNRKLSKHIADASWGNFVNLLQYKCDWYGRFKNISAGTVDYKGGEQ